MNKNTIYNFRSRNILDSQYKDLSDTQPFIDYIQLHCSEVPMSYMMCKESAENRFRFLLNGKFLKYKFDEQGETISIYTLENSVRFYFYGFRWNDDVKPGTNAKVKIYIPGSALPDSSLQVQIRRINDIVKSIHPNKPYHIAGLNNLPTMEMSLKLGDCKVSRIDLAINCFKTNYYDNYGILQNDFNFKDLNVTYKGTPSIRHYFDGPVCTGIDIGSGKDCIQLKVYDKDLDPNNNHDLFRFGTTNFARIEYKIPRKIIKKADLNGFTIDVLSDITTYKILTFWKYCLNNKHVNLWSLYRPLIARNKTIKVDVNITGVRVYQMIKGLMKRFEFYNNYNEMAYKVDEFFNKELKINEKTIKDTNTIIYK